MSLFRWLPLAVIAAFAFWLRTHELQRRPMHADEANQAVKLGELLEAGRYAFDPRDHHGPTLYYAAVPIAWARGERSLAALTETTVRLVPAIFGTISVVLIGCFAVPRRPGASAGTAGAGSDAPTPPLISLRGVAAAAFLAVSPPTVYYSRYFIQETLLVTFTLALFLCARTWWRTGRLRWAVGAGVFVGLMQATKATAPLFLAAGAFAAFVYAWSHRAEAPIPLKSRGWAKPAALAFGAALFTTALLYSSLGTNLGGVRDAIGAYTHAFTRFGAEAPLTGHEKAWWYYLRLFGWYREGLVWHQVPFSTLALVGFIIAWTRAGRGIRWAAVYSVVIAGAFSIFNYKTPWQAVHFVPGFALMAAGALRAMTSFLPGRLVAVTCILITAVTLFQQTWRTSFVRPADYRNPYAYVHSSADVLKIRPLADAAIARAPDQPIRVISEEYWPLPWYLRGLPNVGYWVEPPTDCDGALVIASSTEAENVRGKLRGTYRESVLGLRPGIVCVLFTPEP